MARLLYDTLTATLRTYPRDDDGPVIGLDPRYLEMVVIQQPEPDYDPATQRLQPTEAIDTTAQTVSRGWDVVPLPPPPPAPPEPDWDRFQSQLQTSNGFPDAWSHIFTGDARPGISLIASLAVWQATGQWTQFLVATGACLALLPAEQAAHVGLELLALAHGCNLDPAFCEALEAMLDQGAS